MTLYLYAIVDARPPGPLGKGIARRPLDVARVGRAWIVFERAAARPPTKTALVAHDRVVRRVAGASSAVLPLRFGSTVADRAALAELVAPLSSGIGRALERVRGAAQLTLRVHGARAQRRIPEGAGPGTRWLAARFARSQVPEIAALTEATRGLVREVRIQRHDRDPERPPPPRRSATAHLLATVYHLVAREDVARWRAAVERALPHVAPVTVTATGPWPPYAFAELV